LERLVRLCLIVAVLAGLGAEAGSTARPAKPVLRVTVFGKGAVQSSGGRIDCKARCAAKLRPGTRVGLTAVPDSYFAFVRWTNVCVGLALECVLSVDRDTTVRATFERMRGSLLMTVTGPGAISVEPGGLLVRGGLSQEIPQGVPLTFRPRPDAGAVFKGWGEACASAPLDACTVVPGDESGVAAAFGLLGPEDGSRTLTVHAGSPVTIDPPGLECREVCTESFPAGTVVRLHAENFSSWDGACAGPARTCVLVMDTSQEVGMIPPFPQEWPVLSARLTVAGPGVVIDEKQHIRCGRSGSACLAQAFGGRALSLDLVAKPARGARFGGWGGGCHGKQRTCRASEDVVAFFRRPQR
jgi:hypothetical protein